MCAACGGDGRGPGGRGLAICSRCGGSRGRGRHHQSNQHHLEGSKGGGDGENYEQSLQPRSDAGTEMTDWEEDEEMTDVDMESIRKTVKETAKNG